MFQPQSQNIEQNNPSYPKKHHIIKDIIILIVGLLVLAGIYFGASIWAARDYAGKLSKQELTSEDALAKSIETFIAGESNDESRKAVEEIYSSYEKQKKERPRLFSLPFAEIISPKYGLALECKRAIKRYDNRIKNTLDESLKAANYHVGYTSASLAAVSAVEQSAEVAPGDQLEISINGLADTVRTRTGVLKELKSPVDFFDTHFDAIVELEKTDNSLRQYAEARQAKEVEVEKALYQDMQQSLEVLASSENKLNSYMESLKQKATESRQDSSEVERLERQILE